MKTQPRQTQYISKGAKVAVIDMRSKDGGMTSFEWDIPTNDEGNLVLYAHTFASTLEPTKLANENPLLQAETKIDISERPKRHNIGDQNNQDQYPWLDDDDPRRKMTDEEILCPKVPLDKCVLNAAEKEKLIKLMLENTSMFSIRDEISTCPYFEVKLKLRDDKLFFVRPYNICDPWLDDDDPRRKMTDEEILCPKVPLDKSVLSAAKKEKLIKLMLENTPTFSIRDEIGTCPYFEVKLKLRDNKLFFV